MAEAAAIYDFTFLIDDNMRVSTRATSEDKAVIETKRTFKSSTVKLIGEEFSHHVGDFETHRAKKEKEEFELGAIVTELAIEEIKKEGFDSVIEAYGRHTVSF